MSSKFAIRHPRPDEAAAAAAVLNAHARLLHGVDDTSEEELRAFWASPDVDPARDVFLAEAPDGTLIGYADIGLFADVVWVDLRCLENEVLPPILDQVERRAAERAPGKLWRGVTSELDPAVHELYERRGYSLVRHSFRMEIALTGSLEEPVWPEGISVRSFAPGDEEGLYEAQMDAFADTWSFAREPIDTWRHWLFEFPGFDPALFFLAEGGGEIAGMSLCRPDEGQSDLGWVNILGVRPAFRRRGLALALLLHSFREFANRGFERAGLGVDAENPTGAVRLYERAGMSIVRTSLTYERSPNDVQG